MTSHDEKILEFHYWLLEEFEQNSSAQWMSNNNLQTYNFANIRIEGKSSDYKSSILTHAAANWLSFLLCDMFRWLAFLLKNSWHYQLKFDNKILFTLSPPERVRKKGFCFPTLQKNVVPRLSIEIVNKMGPSARLCWSEVLRSCASFPIHFRIKIIIFNLFSKFI